MLALTFSLLSFIALSVAQNQTASLFIPNADLQSLVGSIVGGDATATTYVVQCANGGSNGAAATSAAATSVAVTGAAASATADLGDDDDVCGFPSPVTIVEGPSTVAYSLALDDSTISLNCVISGSSVAVCTAAATGAILTQEVVPTFTATTLSGTDVSFVPVVITAGSVTNTASTPTSTTASTTGAAKGVSTTSTGGSTGGGTQTQTGSTTSASTKASGAAIHMGPAMGMGAAGVLAAVAAVVL